MLPLKERTHLGDLCFEYENQLLAKEPCPVFDGVVETFQKLSKKYKLFIVSNCACGYIEVMLSTSGLDKYVTDTLCFGQTNTSKGKTIRTLMERNNLCFCHRFIFFINFFSMIFTSLVSDNFLHSRNLYELHHLHTVYIVCLQIQSFSNFLYPALPLIPQFLPMECIFHFG